MTQTDLLQHEVYLIDRIDKQVLLFLLPTLESLSFSLTMLRFVSCRQP